MIANGLFITLEGGDGVGKTTQQMLLAERLRQEGYACLCTREPGGTALGRSLRDLLLYGDPLSRTTELLLCAADRAEHVSKVIAPSLAAGQIVVCDRFTDSTLAYQGYGRRVDLEKIRQLNHLASPPRSPALCPQDEGRDEKREFLGFQCTGTKPRPSPHHMKR